MAEADAPQLYLISPPEVDLDAFPDALGRVLDAQAVACFRLALASTDEDRIARTGDTLRAVCHARDVAIVIADHMRFVPRLGLDGVHLTDGARGVRNARKELGSDAILGAYCRASRHDGLSAGEAGADYVAFGPAGDTALGHDARAEAELFAWWSQMIEVPVVAEGAIGLDDARELAGTCDFVALGAEVWNTDDPAATLGRYAAALG